MNLHNPIVTKAGTYSLDFESRLYNYFAAYSSCFASLVEIIALHSRIVVSTPLELSSSMSSFETAMFSAVVLYYYESSFILLKIISLAGLR
jgi:hypothetical protein